MTSKLGVTSEQAAVGAGAIFKKAKDKLSSDDFVKIAVVVPGMDKLLKAAAKPKKKGAFGGAMGKLSGISSLASTFSKLGLSPDMIGKFTGTILPFVKSKGGDSVMKLLKDALNG